MPTIDELASQVAALEQQMAAITTPPDKYYTSIYSGEEIDAAITKVRSGAMGVSSFNGRAGAVMPQAGDYNAAQIPVSADAGAETVAAALNNKAPAGYGLGANASAIPGNDLNNAILGGFYVISTSVQNIPSFMSGKVLVMPYTNLQYYTQIAFASLTSEIAVRFCNNGVWGPWEYLNPLLSPGVEYRTTERHNGKPVYKKSVNTGALSAGTSKSVAHGVQDIGLRLSALYGLNNDGDNLVGNPGITGILVDGSNITITTAEGSSTSNSWVVIAYTKTTD